MVAKLVTWSITVSAVAALSLVGGAGKGPADDPAETLERMLVAIGSGEYAVACEMTVIDGTPVEDADATGCAERLRIFAEGMSPSDLGRLREVEVEPVSASGSTIAITGSRVAGAPAAYAQSVFDLVRLNGKWYVVGT
ncbi:hypothetical protein FE697_005030 [Mumia zhuanghuii]|uniref:Lumazine-binding n=2 Tax=Mumia TaxID=1546255 RepID=A0ABW1QNZ4_9ACTN|nr:MULTISPECIES: hypothetical protein [Mumia]KAA1425234.1 hypothetical protein FE697_005030 [Mumia zhuanghuii]